MIVTSLLEDFKARWQELLNLENENNRWQTLYVTALMLVIGWIMNSSKDYQSFQDLFDKGNNAVFILTLAGINAIYALAMAYRGYTIQEIALYLYTITAKNINQILDRNQERLEIDAEMKDRFNAWEQWRRSSKGTPKWTRVLYYPIVSILPLLVSFTVLFLYWFYEFYNKEKVTCFKSNCYDIPNHFFIFILLFVIFCLISSLVTSAAIGFQWRKVLSIERHTQNTTENSQDL